MALALLALMVQVDPHEGSVPIRLGYLMRHQAEDGSWGKIPEGCYCRYRLKAPPPDLNPDEATRQRVALLIKKLGDGNIETREEAQQALLKTGPRATPQVWKSLHDPDPEVAARCEEILLKMHPAKGGKTGNAATTGLSLLSLLTWGYCHLSRDIYAGICIGDVMRKSLKWIMSQQNHDGTFSRDPEENALATLAVSEAYGLTGSGLFKDSAERGCDSVMKLNPKKTKLLILKGLVFHSMTLNGTETASTTTYREISEALSRRTGDLALAGSIVFHLIDDKENRGDHVDPERILELDPPKLDPMALFLASRAARMLGKRAWMERVKEALWSEQVNQKYACEHGSWNGVDLQLKISIITYRSLTWESFLRRSCAFPIPR